MKYITQSGDSFDKIAKALTLSEFYADPLARHNVFVFDRRVPTWKQLRRGMEIDIPDDWVSLR